MCPRSVFMIARDIAPSGAFERFSAELSAKNISCNSCLGNGKPIDILPEEIAARARFCDMTLIGMSSSSTLSKEERVAGKEAIAAGKILAVYDDIEGGFNRPWFKEDPDNPGQPGLLHKANLIFVVDEKNAEAARKLYPNAKIVASGNPIVEESFFPKFSREEVRLKFGVAEDEIMVLCVGDKTQSIGLPLFNCCIDAIHLLAEETKQKFKVFLALHPGDMAIRYVYDATNVLQTGDYTDDDLNQRSIYRELVKFGSGDEVTVRIVTRKTLRTDEILPGVDIVVQAGSTTSRAAACLRKPVIDVRSQVTLNWFKHVLGNGGWEIVEQGVSVAVPCSPDHLQGAINTLLTPEGFALIRHNQETMYPKPKEKGSALKKIAAEIVNLLT